MTEHPYIDAMLRVLRGEVAETIPDDYAPGPFARAVQAEAERRASQLSQDAPQDLPGTKFTVRNTNPPQIGSQRF